MMVKDDNGHCFRAMITLIRVIIARKVTKGRYSNQRFGILPQLNLGTCNPKFTSCIRPVNKKIWYLNTQEEQK